MKIFLSWAGSESRQLAIIFEKWLRMVLQTSKPWMSTNIEKGEGWDKEIHAGLKDTKVGILFLTKESIDSIYLHYEAGAISNVDDALVCTLLYGLRNADLKQPLSRFQTTQFEREDVFKLIKTINAKIIGSGGNVVTEDALREIFDVTWDRLQKDITEIDKKSTSGSLTPVKEDRELLEEILEAVRSMQSSDRSKATRKGLDISKGIPLTSLLVSTILNQYKQYLADYNGEPGLSENAINELIAYADNVMDFKLSRAHAIYLMNLLVNDINPGTTRIDL